MGSLIERDESPEPGQQASIDQVISTPNEPPHTSLRDRIAQLSTVKTPKTLPRPGNAEMNPKTLHQTTAKQPDSGLKLGFSDIKPNGRASLATMQNSPTKSLSRPSLPQDMSSP